jgi:integrase
MPAVQLTDISIRSLKPPAKGQVTYWDKTVSGFGVRVSQGGTKAFVLMHGANRQRITIGKHPILSLAEARQEAKRLLAEHTLGKHRPVTITFDDAKDAFLEDNRQRNAPRTVYDYQRLLNRHFKFGKAHLSVITRHDVMRRIDKLSGTPSEQNYAFVTARTFFKWAVRSHYLDQSPLEGLSLPARIQSRERILTENELGAVYGASLAFPWPFGQIVSLLALTGQRRGEVSALRWEWINQEEKLITFPATATKNRRAHTIPYGGMAHVIISNLPEIGEYVFPASRIRNRTTTTFNGWSKSKSAFDKTLENLEPWTLHDIRRTFSSCLAAHGAPIHVTEKILNHVSGSISGVAAIYNRHAYLDEMREAIATYEDFLAKLVAPKG